MNFVVSRRSCTVNHNDVLVKIFLVNKQTVSCSEKPTHIVKSSMLRKNTEEPESNGYSVFISCAKILIFHL